MQVTPASSSPAAAAAPLTAGSATSSALSETQFLQLLTKQLENQDPLQPQSDTQFLAQMAQFTSLQETDTLNQQVERLTASNYIGSTVTVNSGNSLVTGQVTGVDTSATDPKLIINGAEYPLSALQLITPTVATPPPAAAAPAVVPAPAKAATSTKTLTSVAAALPSISASASLAAAPKS